MEKYHKHKGVESKGKLKLHPITQNHKDPQVQKWHNLSLASNLKAPTPPESMNTLKNSVQEPAKVRIPGVYFEDGFVYVDMEKFPKDIQGLRVKVVRREGNKRRTVGVEFVK